MRTVIPITKFTFLCTALAGALLTFSENASALSIRNVGASSRSSERSSYVTQLTGLAAPSNRGADRLYFRPDNPAIPTESADLVHARSATPSRESVTVPRPGGVPGGVGGGGAVPDGGTTVMLLGASLSALAMARRYLMS